MKSKIKSALTVGVALCALNATAAFAASQSFTAPNVITTAGATQLTKSSILAAASSMMARNMLCTYFSNEPASSGPAAGPAAGPVAGPVDGHVDGPVDGPVDGRPVDGPVDGPARCS